MKTMIMMALSLLVFTALPAWADNHANTAKIQIDAQTGNQAYPFTLPPLPYDYAALQPFIDGRTMEIHYTRHHKAYVDNLNKAIEGKEALYGKTLDDILATISTHESALRNNAGGHWNHSFFWSLMAPHHSGREIPATLKNAIEADFGSIDRFKQDFEKAGMGRFGSGWVWLIVDKDGKLAITSTPNQDNPLMDDAKIKGTPILGNDVWEHAYYLHYQNKRNDYLKNWWSIVNWDQVARNYNAARQPQ